MKPNYNNFLKTWSTENKITSFFGSDKPDFLKAWANVKNEAVKKKEVAMKPKEEVMKPKEIIFEDEPMKPKNKKEDLINEWTQNTLPILLYQLYPKIYQAIEKKVLQLNNKKLYILPTELAYFLKDFLNDLFIKYGQNKKALDIILFGINNIIEDIIPDYKEPEEKNYRNMMKYFNAKNKKIIGNLTR